MNNGHNPFSIPHPKIEATIQAGLPILEKISRNCFAVRTEIQCATNQGFPLAAFLLLAPEGNSTLSEENSRQVTLEKALEEYWKNPISLDQLIGSLFNLPKIADNSIDLPTQHKIEAIVKTGLHAYLGQFIPKLDLDSFDEDEMRLLLRTLDMLGHLFYHTSKTWFSLADPSLLDKTLHHVMQKTALYPNLAKRVAILDRLYTLEKFDKSFQIYPGSILLLSTVAWCISIAVATIWATTSTTPPILGTIFDNTGIALLSSLSFVIFYSLLICGCRYRISRNLTDWPLKKN